MNRNQLTIRIATTINIIFACRNNCGGGQKQKGVNMKKIILILSVIVLIVCVLLAGQVDSEEKMYLESTPKHTPQSRIIKR